MSIIKSFREGIRNKWEDHKNKKKLKKALNEDAQMDIIKARLEARKEQEIYLAQQKEKIKAKHELDKYHKKLKSKNPKNKLRIIKLVLLLILIILLAYLIF